jgi:hypothetical protein
MIKAHSDHPRKSVLSILVIFCMHSRTHTVPHSYYSLPYTPLFSIFTHGSHSYTTHVRFYYCQDPRILLSPPLYFSIQYALRESFRPPIIFCHSAHIGRLLFTGVPLWSPSLVFYAFFWPWSRFQALNNSHYPPIARSGYFLS